MLLPCLFLPRSSQWRDFPSSLGPSRRTFFLAKFRWKGKNSQPGLTPFLWEFFFGFFKENGWLWYIYFCCNQLSVLIGGIQIPREGCYPESVPGAKLLTATSNIHLSPDVSWSSETVSLHGTLFGLSCEIFLQIRHLFLVQPLCTSWTKMRVCSLTSLCLFLSCLERLHSLHQCHGNEHSHRCILVFLYWDDCPRELFFHTKIMECETS